MSDKFKFPSNDEDDIEDRGYTFGSKIDNTSFSQHYNQYPVISYKYVDLNSTEYSFFQPCLNNSDIQKYFEIQKKLSVISINNLIDKSNYKDHFHVYNKCNGTLKNLIATISKKTLDYHQIPPIGQFSLYTSATKANRGENIKSPRIYFMIGDQAIFYILFYDPYHEINPGK